VQCVPPDVGNRLVRAVGGFQIDLVQMAAAVGQPVKAAPVGQGGVAAVACPNSGSILFDNAS
ncbi:hypothetical protein ACFX58_19545, partial [Sphingomonas sp. NCPPB 2930]